MNIEKLKSQKDIFVDMRSDGEITKVDVNVNGRKNNPVVWFFDELEFHQYILNRLFSLIFLQRTIKAKNRFS